MNQSNGKHVRILAIAPTARGFGYAVMENQVMLECGNKGVKGNKNQQSVSKIEKLMNLFQPGVIVLPNVTGKGCNRAPRIKALHRHIIGQAAKQKCKVALLSRQKLRMT